jgi:predicted ribosomally synthesized peptide with SipW-like signal peptide
VSLAHDTLKGWAENKSVNNVRKRGGEKRMDKKILVSVMVIGLVAALAGAGLYAYFSDVETSTGNTFTAGTLDLTVDGHNDPGVPTYVTLEDMAPCEWAEIGPIKLKNVGTIDGYADLHFEIIDYHGGENPEPEVEYESEHGVDDYIADMLWVSVAIDVDKDGDIDKDDTIIIGDGGWTLHDLNCETIWLDGLDAGEEIWLFLDFHLDADAENDCQGDWVKFAIHFTLDQVGPPP